MRLSKHIGRATFTLAFTWSARTHGYTSYLKDGSHFPMWDFDEATLPDVVTALTFIQAAYKLGDIHIFQSSDEKHYHAAGMIRLPWHDALSVVMCTPGIDTGYVKLAMMRDHFTLRYALGEQPSPHIVHTLYGAVPNTVAFEDIYILTEYWRKIR